MRLLTIIVALVTLPMPGCLEDSFDVNGFRDDPSVASLNGKWKVISFEDYSKRTVEFKTQDNSWNGDICVTFDDTVDPKWFAGGIITNHVFGEFDYLGDRHFRLRRLGTTFVGEPAWGDKFRKAVCGERVKFKINAQRLRLYFDNNRQSVTLARV